MPIADCHCGKIRIEVRGQPAHLIDCNCSICRRLGALWAFFPLETARIEGVAEHGVGYVWGEKTITTFHCRHCGCVTHWEPLVRKPDAQFAINTRLVDPAEMAGVKVRRFDGADSWAYLD